MKVSDYIVEYLIGQEITDVFGYPGGMVTHFMDSLNKYGDKIHQHITYHEQGASFAACGYAQASGKVGVAYATSGPGATNLITGICNAYFDSTPVLFITGQVNRSESKGEESIRQRGFQELDIVSMVRPVVKYVAYIDNADEIKEHLDKAFASAQSGRKGPCLLDIPMDIMRANIDINEISAPMKSINNSYIDTQIMDEIKKAWDKSSRPLILFGNGIKANSELLPVRNVLDKLQLPVVTTMPAIDVYPNNLFFYGFIGAYGNRTANFIAAKCDLLLCIGARLDIRQVGANRNEFAPNAKIIRIDVDINELSYKVHADEISVHADALQGLKLLSELAEKNHDYSEWRKVCKIIHEELHGYDNDIPNQYMQKMSQYFRDNSLIITDVGQNQVWAAQSLVMKPKQKILFSGGHGAMGYAIPAAIGARLATGKETYCICGDGGFQMNVQELQTIIREKLPIKIILMNNHSLGMIRHFQEMYFNKRYVLTTETGGYTVPDFQKIACAYGLNYCLIQDINEITDETFQNQSPVLIEVRLCGDTHVFPKLKYGKPNQDQEPLIDRGLYDYLMSL